MDCVGAFNTNILRRAVNFLEEQRGQGKEVTVSLAGRKSIDFFKRRDWPIRQEWGGVFDRLSFEHALDIGQNIVSHYHDGTFDHLYVVYNEFKSVMQQEVVVEKLLPIESLNDSDGGGTPSLGGGYLYEPMPISDQVISIYAGVNGFLDTVPVNKIREFERDLIEHFKEKHPALRDEVKTKKKIDDALGGQLKDIINKFKKSKGYE